MKKLLILLLVLLSVSVYSCASATTTQGKANTIEEAHPDRIEKTIIGMELDDFKIIWPEAVRSGLSADGEVFEFTYVQLGPLGQPNGTKIIINFYFTDNKLIKYESNKKFL